jgi:tetratricopeptide (TPR) repeat protein
MLDKIKIFFLHLAVIAVLGVGCYSNSLSGKFIWDDEALIVNNSYLRSPFNIAQIVTHDISSGAGAQSRFWRPLQNITYAFDYHFWQLNPFGYHLANILLHLLAAFALYFLVLVILKNSIPAFLAAALFVVHPLHTEAVAYISGRADLLAGALLFFITAIYILRNDRDNDGRSVLCGNLGVWTLILGYSLALSAKEYSLIFPLFILVCRATLNVKLERKTFLAVLLISVFYLYVRSLLFEEKSAFYFTGIFTRFAGFLAAFADYLRLLCLPFGLHMEYGQKNFSFYHPKVICGFFLLSGGLVSAYLLRKKNRVYLFSLVWFLVGLLPVANLWPINAYMAEHWLYVPSLGFFLIIAYGVNRLMTRGWLKWLGVVVLAGLVIFYSFLTFRQNYYWNNPADFYKRTLAYSPRSSRMHLRLGDVYYKDGNMAKAQEEYRKALRLTPNAADAYQSVGFVLEKTGRVEEAVVFLEKALRLDSRNPDIYRELASAYLACGQIVRARSLLEEFLKIDPKASVVYNDLAVICAMSGDYDRAKFYCRKARQTGYKVHPGLLRLLDNN